MSLEGNIQAQLDAYLDGEMSSSQRSEFEAKLKDDASLQEALELEKLVRGAMVEQELRSWDEEVTKLRSHGRNNASWIYVTAGVVAVALVFLFSMDWSDEVVTSEMQEEPTSKLTELPTNELKEEGASVDETSQVALAEPHRGTNQVAEIESQTQTEEAVEQEEEEVVTGANVSNLITQEAQQTQENSEETVSREDQSPKANEVIDCDKVRLTAKVLVEESCEGEATGVIELSSIKGGSAPYGWKLNGEEQEGARAVELYADAYEVVLHDANGCITILDQSVVVSEKFCFSPEPGMNSELETWVYEVRGAEAVISIFDRSGKEVKTEHFEDRFEWDGTTNQGEVLPVGIYYYRVKQEGREEILGSMNIIR